MIQHLGKLAVGQDRDCADVWNDLWDNSGDAMPLARAENLKRFGEHFGAMELRRLQGNCGRCDRGGRGGTAEVLRRLFVLCRSQ